MLTLTFIVLFFSLTVCKGFGGIGGILRYQGQFNTTCHAFYVMRRSMADIRFFFCCVSVDFLTMEVDEVEDEDDFI